MIEKPKTYEDAIDLSEVWDQVADNETDDEREYHRLRERAARYRKMALRLPKRIVVLDDPLDGE
jgi:hypothetical protein